MTFTWKIGGEAGFGIMTTGLMVSKMASRLGYSIFDYVEYPSLIRGGHNAYEITVGDTKVNSLKSEIDILVCLNQETYQIHQGRLAKDALVVYDGNEWKIDDKINLISVPFGAIISELNGQAVMRNTIAFGATAALVGADFSVVQEILVEQFDKKGDAVIKFNLQFAERGFNYIKDKYQSFVRKYLSVDQRRDQLVMTGNEAFSLGAVIADCRLYAAYPMTPSSGVLTTLAGWQEKNHMIVRHSEDEISVINTAIGASYAGVRSAVGTSGGGFALMVESLSFAGVAEIPLVIFLAQRPGPATGMPTWTEQGDLLFAVHAGHGEFPKVVLAPGDIGEMITMTAEAFNLADIYQLPVIIMSEMYLSESHSNIKLEDVNLFIRQYQINRGKIMVGKITDKPYKRYLATDDGVSPRLIPGAVGAYYQANSYEHLEDGHTTENASERIKQVNKRSRKTATYLQSHFIGPSVYGDLDQAKTVLVGWGGTKGILLDVQGQLQDSAVIHFHHLYPLAKDKIIPLLTRSKRYVLVENNSTGQLGKLLLQETGVEIAEKILRFDGRPLTVKEIINKLT